MVKKNERDSLPLPLLLCESWMFVKENADRKKIALWLTFFVVSFDLELRKLLQIYCQNVNQSKFWSKCFKSKIYEDGVSLKGYYKDEKYLKNTNTKNIFRNETN